MAIGAVLPADAVLLCLSMLSRIGQGSPGVLTCC
jgi:hypothetical protein